MIKQKEFSLLKGYFFSFNDGGNQIEAWFSSLTGSEKVFVNGEMVSSQRTLSAISTNTFKIVENEYSIHMHAVSLIKGPFICTLNKNRKVYKRQKLVFPKPKKYLIAIGIGLAFGGSYIVAITKWGSSKEFMFISILAILFAALLIKFCPSSFNPTIEEVKIE